MNTKRTVYEKINSISPKVELSQVEVALSIKDDITKMLSDYESASKTLDGKIVKFYDNILLAKKSFEALKGDADKWASYKEKFKIEKDKALALGKELGIDVTGAPFYKDLLATSNRFNDMNAALNDANNTYKSIKF